MIHETEEGGIQRDPPLLHLYAGPAWHMEGYVIGNRAGLMALRDAIDKSLKGDGFQNSGQEEVSTRDGEGYDVIVIRQDTSWQGALWSNLMLPYTDDDAVLSTIVSENIGPDELLGKKSSE